MPEKFCWSPKVIAWLGAVVFFCSVISYNMPEHPSPTETVFVPGYQFIQYAIYIFGIAIVLAVIRNRTILLNFEANWLESFVALNGAALFISPFVALLFRYASLLLAKANT